MQSLKQDDEKWGIGQEERLKPGRVIIMEGSYGK